MIDHSRLGIVSNCWQHQLARGQPLEDLIGQAVETSGFRHIELRQGSLGTFEDSDGIPDAGTLPALARMFPQVSFHLAVELPVFSEPFGDADARRQSYSAAAESLSQHLRIVDPVAVKQEDPVGDRIDLAVANLVSLVAELHGGVVSVEHSVQPWSLFQRVFERARERCLDHLKLCYDPANLWLTGDGPRAAQITEQLPSSVLSMVHLKQRRNGTTLPAFVPGEVDWQKLLRILSGRQYAGPCLFEIAPSDRAQEELRAAVHSLDRLLRGSI